MALAKLNSNASINALAGRFLTASPLIGLDLGLEKLNLVQVDFKAGKPVIISASSDYHNSSYEDLLQHPEQFRQLVRSALKSGHFKGRKVVATVPPALLKILFLNFQCKAHEIEAQALLNALKNRIHDDFSSFIIDYIAINPQLNEQINRMALVAMAKHDAIEDFLDLLAGCGLSIEALEIGPVAIKRLITAITASQDSQKVLAINFGVKKSYLTVIWNNALLLDREIHFGMDNILQAVAKSFDVNTQTALEVLHQYGLDENQAPGIVWDEEGDDGSIKNILIDILRPVFIALADEIKEVLVYVASETRGGAVEFIYLMGSLARISAVDQIIDQLISIPVQTINPFYGFQTDNKPYTFDDVGPLAGVAVATGLSMRGKI